jgi:uncharacterized protein YnzC (UPF0291/DUF896 family)
MTNGGILAHTHIPASGMLNKQQWLTEQKHSKTKTHKKKYIEIFKENFPETPITMAEVPEY